MRSRVSWLLLQSMDSCVWYPWLMFSNTELGETKKMGLLNLFHVRILLAYRSYSS